MTTIVMRAFEQMEISPFNTRKVEPSHVQELAASIKARREKAQAEGRDDSGLIMPLHCTPGTGKGKKKAKDGVVDGGSRLRALALLVEQGVVAPTDLFPTVDCTPAEAVELSLMANKHEQMHPMDQAEAMVVLIQAGKSEEDCAHAFGLPLQTVRQRLKLANCSERVRNEYRTGQLTIEQMVAFALSNDHAEQDRILDDMAHSYDKSAYYIKKAITAEEAPVEGNKHLAFVGRDSYLAAGGEIRPDMFKPEGGYIVNLPLLRELAAAKQQDVVDALIAEGWDFVLIESSVYEWKYGTVDIDFSDRYTKAQKKQISTLQKAVDAKQAACDALEEVWQNDDDMDYDDYEVQAQPLEEERAAAQAALDAAVEAADAHAWTAEERATCGVLVMLDDDGLTVSRGRLRPANANVVTNSEGKAEIRSFDSIPTTQEPKARPDHSDALLRNLTACRSAATARTLMQQPERTVALLAATIAEKMFSHGSSSDALTLSFGNNLRTWKTAAPQLESNEGFRALESESAFWSAKFADARDHETGTSFFDVAVSLSASELMQFLAFATALTVNGVNGQITHENRTSEGRSQRFAQIHGVNMVQHWEATAGSYFEHVKKDVMAKALQEAGVPADSIAAVRKAKKTEGPAMAEGLIAGKGWLPEPLR